MHSMADQASKKHFLWLHELVLLFLSSNIGHAWRLSAPPPVSFRVFIYQHTGRSFERADFTKHPPRTPMGNEQCWGLEIHHQECPSPWRPNSRRLPAVRWSINNQLSKFIVETRKTNGAQYLPATLHSLLCGILRCMRELNPACRMPKLPWKERHQIQNTLPFTRLLL